MAVPCVHLKGGEAESVGAWAVAICLADPRFRRAGFCPCSKTVKLASSGEHSKYVARTQNMSMCSVPIIGFVDRHHISNIETLHASLQSSSYVTWEESPPTGR